MSDVSNVVTLNQMITDFSNEVVVTPEILQERRARILQLEETMKMVPGSYDMASFNPGKIKHHFSSGVYGRELFIPAGNTIVSKIHKGKTLNVIVQGVIRVIDPEKGVNTYVAPHIFVSEPMTKRVVQAIEDTIWVTSHANPTNTENLDEIENETIAQNFNLLTQENL